MTLCGHGKAILLFCGALGFFSIAVLDSDGERPVRVFLLPRERYDRNSASKGDFATGAGSVSAGPVYAGRV